MNGWQSDKKWSDRFIPEIKRIIAPHVIGESSIDDDQQRNTDLIVLKAEAKRIACRVRRPEYFLKFQHDITIRSDRPSGTETELRKIVKGWGDLFFYGHSDDDCSSLRAWAICDLNEFRSWLNDCMYQNHRFPGKERENKDNSSKFHAFDIREMPKEVLVEQFGFDLKSPMATDDAPLFRLVKAQQ